MRKPKAEKTEKRTSPSHEAANFIKMFAEELDQNDNLSSESKDILKKELWKIAAKLQQRR